MTLTPIRHLPDADLLRLVLGDEAAANDALRHAGIEWIGGAMSLAEA